MPVEAASGTQRDLTTAVEVARRGDFERAIDSLPVDDRRRTAFHANAGCKLSRVWIAGIPDGIYEGAPARHFVEGVASYFGTASPCASPIVGETIFDKDGRNRGYVNKYGDALASLSLIGAGWIRHHDAIKDALCNSMTELGIDASTEVFGLSYLASKASKTCRAISNIAELLTADNNEAWCAIYYSSQHKLQYWLDQKFGLSI